MKRGVGVLSVVLLVACGGKKDAASCESVGKKLVELEAGDKASFMTDKERATRAKRWVSRCEPLSEPARRCVLAATTMDQAEACGSANSGSTAPTNERAKAAWTIRGGDSASQDAQFITFAPDGDIIVAGDFDGTLDLGGQTVKAERTDGWVARLDASTGVPRWVKRVGGPNREFVTGLGVGADGRVHLTLSSDEPPRLTRVTLAADGTATRLPIETELDVNDAAAHANGDIVIGSGKNIACAGFAFQRVAPDGNVVWTRCNDGKGTVTPTSERTRIVAGPNGKTAVCGGFSGALSWGGKAAPDAEPDKDRVYVMVLDEKGEPAWVDYVAGRDRTICKELTMTDDGGVAAVLYGATPGAALTAWDATGTRRWTHSCSDLLDGGECDLSAIAGAGADVIVASGGTVLVTIDMKTGATKQTTTFEDGVVIDALAVRGKATAFATGFNRPANFGAGALQTSAGPDGDSTDVLVGRL